MCEGGGSVTGVGGLGVEEGGEGYGVGVGVGVGGGGGVLRRNRGTCLPSSSRQQSGVQ